MNDPMESTAAWKYWYLFGVLVASGIVKGADAKAFKISSNRATEPAL